MSSTVSLSGSASSHRQYEPQQEPLVRNQHTTDSTGFDLENGETPPSTNMKGNKIGHIKQALGRYYPVVILLSIFLIGGIIIIAIAQSHLLDPDDPTVMPSDPYERALTLMSRYPVIDGHNDLAWQIRLNGSATVFAQNSWDLKQNLSAVGIQTDIVRMRAGHVGGTFFSVYTRCGMPDAVRVTFEQIDIVKSFVKKYSSTFQLALTSADIDASLQAGKIASLLGIEGGHSIDSSVGALRAFYSAGVRYMTLTHNCNNIWAESCCPSAEDPYPDVRGLTNTTDGSLAGIDVVREMNRIGMMVDISHTSAHTMRDALRVTRAPVMFSHAGVYELVKVPRNVPDDVLHMLRAKNGIIMIYTYNDFTRTRPGPNTVLSIADHFDYVRNLFNGSVTNLGIGSDFDGDDLFSTEYPIDMSDTSHFPNLIAELIRRGYTDDELKLILGENLKRVLKDVETVAEQLQQEELQVEKRILYPKQCRSDF